MNIQNPLAPFKWTLLFCILLISGIGYSQCAGTNGSVTVCEKDADENNKTFDLFAHIGAYQTGGTWSTNDPANFFALKRDTGILNLWDVKNSGEHVFTYTNTCGGVTESAQVTINLGGYPGEDNTDGSADACGDDSEVNLHSYIGDETDGKFQDFNGTWATITTGAAIFLNENIFNAAEAGVGIYEFTHTVPAVGTCASRTVRLVLEVQRPAKSGTGTDRTFCITDDLSGFTNFNLNTLLADEDENGTWSEGVSTHQLSDLTDHIIDIQAIRDANGFGTYTFTYTVFPGHPVCMRNSTEVNIIILPTLRGTMEASNYCSGPSEYTVNITDYDDALLTNGTYPVTYTLTSAGTTRMGTDDLVLRTDRTGSFDIDASLIPLNQTAILTITSLGADVCADIQVSPISFVVTDPDASVTDACEGETLSVALTNIFDAASSPASGAYDITYTLTSPSTVESTFTEHGVNFSSGNGNFIIPANQLPETGAYDIRFEVANGFPLACALTDTATVTAIPSKIDIALFVDDSCDATKIDVSVDAPNLGDGTYTITYDVIHQSTGQVVLNNDESKAINFNGGTAFYDIDVSSLEPGNYTVTVRSTQDDTTPCRLEFDFEVSENFAVEGVPALPVVEAQQTFCLSAFTPDSPTLADIDVSASGQIMFYATATDMDILAMDTPLVHNEDYFISNIDPNNNCEGSDRIQVTVVLENPDTPAALDTNPVFCDSENPTVSNLNASIDGNMGTVWFEAAFGGTALDQTIPLTNGKSYFASTETERNCTSTGRLEIVPTVYALEPVSLQFGQLALCGLDNPTVSDLRDTENNNPYDVLWYDTVENGSPLTDDIRLTTNTTYYAESFNPDTGCMNPERMAVTVDLTNCEPEDYGFFIPDGFSPNGDGRNDTFYIPNIEIIFPEFTLEILNRYGSTLFKGNRSQPAWDGKKAPNGVYFYVVNYNKDGHGPIQGRLYLNR